MNGWSLNNGKLIETDLSLLMPTVSQALMDQKYKTTTYKYSFFLALLCANCQLVESKFSISFSLMVPFFSKSYWDLINVFGIPQKYNCMTDSGSSMEIMIDDMLEKYPHLKGVHFDSLKDSIKTEIIRKTESIFKKYVVGAFYAETNGYLYGFDKKKEEIYINIEIHSFLNENKILLEQLCYFQWVKMCGRILEKCNLNVPTLPLIIENISKRKSLSCFKKSLKERGANDECFYCGKKHSNRFALDHVIPWYFIKDDNLWNLVWCCPHCNGLKSNRIPDKKFLEKLKERNLKMKIESPNLFELANIAFKNGVRRGWKP